MAVRVHFLAPFPYHSRCYVIVCFEARMKGSSYLRVINDSVCVSVLNVENTIYIGLE